MKKYSKILNKAHTSKLIQKQLKFVRRKDLTPDIRLQIAYTALMAQTFNNWGVITALSLDFMISRTFIYMLAAALKQTSDILFSSKLNQRPVINYRIAFSYILSLRLEGKCSLLSISSIMKRFDMDLAGVGTISQYLTFFGSLLSNTLSTDDNDMKLVVFLSDEIFLKKIPILITVDSKSSAILRIDSDSEHV
jgi:hypothetical protein